MKKKNEARSKVTVVSSRGQVTIPQEIREIFHLKEGVILSFEAKKNGILMVPMKVVPKDPYTEEEWKKIQKLSKSKGKTFDNAEDLKDFLDKV